jgi:hypothetical protein
MNNQSNQIKETYIIFVPENSDRCVPGALSNVVVNTDQKVEWIWTHLQNGKSAVTGYRILKSKIAKQNETIL